MYMFRMERKLTAKELFFPFSASTVFSLAVAVGGWKLAEFAFNSTSAGFYAGLGGFILSMFVVRFIVRGMSK